MNNMSENFWKAIATIVIWAMSFVSIVIGSIFVAPTLGEDFLGFIFMVMGAAIVTSGFVWNWGRLPQDAINDRIKKEKEERKKKNKGNSDDEYFDLFYAQTGNKRKNNDRLASALRQLSDDELVRLRDRIASGEIREEDLEDVLYEEGRY